MVLVNYKLHKILSFKYISEKVFVNKDFAPFSLISLIFREFSLQSACYISYTETVFRIQQSQSLKWEVTIGGSKNAALPLIAATLLIPGKTTLTNVPDILDVHDFIHFLRSIGCQVSFQNSTLQVDNSDINWDTIDTSMIARTRAGIYFVAWLLSRFWSAQMPYPQGDKIGKRPIDEHIEWYQNMGYQFELQEDILKFSSGDTKKESTIYAYFAVTATANLIMWAVGRKANTTIKLAAFEPHIFNLIDFLRSAGVQIDIRYDHTIIIHGGATLKNSVSHEVISDYLQSGTFAIIGALCAKEYIDIKQARIKDLSAFLYKLNSCWVQTQDLWNDTLRVYRSNKLTATNIQTNIFPGFPTDLMPLFSVLMTQCQGTSRIHEVLYEGRLNWLVEYERLGGQARIINLHEAKISGPTQLIWNKVNSWDLRSGAAMVIAGMIAEGETIVENIYWIKRGYDDFLWKLQSLGADITDIS